MSHLINLLATILTLEITNPTTKRFIRYEVNVIYAPSKAQRFRLRTLVGDIGKRVFIPHLSDVVFQSLCQCQYTITLPIQRSRGSHIGSRHQLFVSIFIQLLFHINMWYYITKFLKYVMKFGMIRSSYSNSVF